VKLIAIVGLVWCGALAAGAHEIYAYSTQPGDRAEAPARWPVESTLAGPDDRAAIVMFVHPACPCSRASLAELAAIAESTDAAIQIVFPTSGEGWEAAGRVRGATRILDPLAGESARFGARTSGHVVVYDRAGALRYAGGITGSRGHRGTNVGRQTVERIVAGSSDRDTSHVVFGCGLGGVR
jgi:hypothetical protein